MAKTRKEIEDLKHNWNGDSCWDIEETEGFEEHKDELLIHRLTMEKKWSESYDKDLLAYSIRIGTGSQKLADYVRSMEKTIDKLEQRIYNLENK